MADSILRLKVDSQEYDNKLKRAAEQLNRRCFMMELDARYCDVIISRWETFTGKTAQLITPGDKVS